MPVRKIPKNYRNITGVAPHSKAEGEAGYESSLERDFLILLEFNPNVTRFEVQPVMIQWVDESGKPRRYTPDVFVQYHHSNRCPILYEVKYRSDLKKNWDTLRPKFKAAIHYAKERDWRFKLVTEVEIQSVFLNNAKFLLPFIRRGPQQEEHMDILADTLESLKVSTPEQLIKTIFRNEWHQAELMPTLWYLIGTRQIDVELSQPLTMKSEIRWNQS